MRSEILSGALGVRSRLLRAGLALVMSALLPAQGIAVAAPGLQVETPGKPGASKAAATSLLGSLDSQALENKVHPEVKAAFSKSGKVTYLVKLRAKADVTSAASAARAGATPATADLKARSAVISALKETATLTQSGLLAQLEKAQATGQVSEYTSFWVANMVAVTSTHDVMEKIARRPDVEKIYPNAEIRLVDGKAGQAGAVATAPSGSGEINTVEWNIQRIGAPNVWSQFGIDGAGTVVASLDTGVDGAHPALVNQYRGRDPVTGQVDHTYSWFDAVNGRSAPYDDHGHGTHTTGTMVGRDPSGANEVGVAPGARWIAAKILNAAGSGTAQNILAAGQWVLAPGGDPSKAPDVVNNSWGGGPGLDEWFRDVVIAWRAAGIVPVFAAGNDGPGSGTVSEPSNYPEAIAVGATDANDNLASFSGRGPSPYGELKPELSAPGVNVRSTVPGGGYEGGWSGTSMAAPHVAGAVALLRQADASLTVDEIEQILIQSADPATNAQYPEVPNNGFGHGILNAYTAVGMVASGIGSVSGRVMTGGDDLNPPTLAHTPVTEGFKHTDTTILVDVSDDVSVTAVYLRFRQPGMQWWGIVDMERIAGDHKQGTYSGVIPAELATTDTIEYYIEAVDYGNNHAFHGTRLNPHRIAMLNGLTPGYLQDFEGSVAGWQTAGTPAGVWQIGVPTSGPGSAHSGTKVAATNLTGNYPDSANAYLITPPIDLSGGPAALRFYHWYDLETNWDYGIVAVTGDGGATWEIKARYTGANGAYGEAVIDLSNYAGNPAVFVAFVLQTDGSVTKPGWYIDDVELYRDEEPPAAPTNLTAQATPVGSIALTWDPVSAGDLSHYTIYRSQTSGSGYTAIGQSTNASFVDGSTSPNTTYYYVVTATDQFDNESGPSNEASATAGNVRTRFFDDMEGGPGAWTHSGTNDPWEWGVPTSGPGGAASGQNLWATGLATNYPHNANASLVTPPIDLSGLTAAALQFSHWYSLERNWDFGRLEITADGGTTWTQLAQYTSPGPSGQPVGWESPLIDLSAYVGQTVQIRFRLTSDGSVNYAGWYIDDVRVAGITEGGSQVELGLSVKEDGQPAKNGQKPTAPESVSIALPSSKATEYRLDKGTGTGAVKADKGIMALPVDATVTVVETGRVVRTNPADGSYQITLPAGVYTLRAEAYGYYPSERQVEIIDGENATANFVLQPIPRGLIHGIVVNSVDGSPIAGARVRVAEDLRVPEVTTGASGQFVLDVLAGSYTVEVRHQSFYPASVAVEVPANGSVDVEIAMEPFVGMPGEIGYDDGTAENAWAFFSAGNGWAVRMSPQHGQTAFVTAARFFLWGPDWPIPGGNSFRAAIFAANPDGTPGAMLAGPIVVNNAVRGAWNEVDFSEYGVAVTGDFYVAYIQDQDNPNTPGLGFDETTDQGRTWQVVSGSWSPWTEGGNAMIRAVVNYAVGAPTITSPADGSHVNTTTVEVRGSSPAGTTVRLYVDGELAAETTPDANGQFAATLEMAEGTHELTATATVPDGRTTRPSAPVRVTVDLTAPELTVTAPEEGAMLDSRLLTITGQVADQHLAGVTVNGTAAQIDADGQFTVEIIGREGENEITAVATDLAGNTTTVTRVVYVDSVAPVLSNLEPSTDQYLVPGDTITVSFESEPGLALAAFKIVLDAAPGGGNSQTDEESDFSLEPGEMAMAEVAPGRYEATWTVPAEMNVAAAYVEFRAVDAAGNTTRKTASGVLHIQSEQSEPEPDPEPQPEPEPEPDPEPDPEPEPEPDPQPQGPTARIDGPIEGKVGKQLRFDGRASSGPAKIVFYAWDMGDGRTLTGPVIQYKYAAPGTYTVSLTVTDADGMTATTSITVVITAK